MLLRSYDELWRDVVYVMAPQSARRLLSQSRVPPGACLLLDLLLAKPDREVIPGDIEEEFKAKVAKYGPRAARLWVWAETMRVIVHRNPICRWLLIAGLIRVGKWIIRIGGG
jgi:hypothetical protein